MLSYHREAALQGAL